MLLGIVLLYVGAVLAVNGIWLIGQARAAAAQAAAAAQRVPVAAYGGGEPAVSVPRGAGRTPAQEAAAEAAAGEELAGEELVTVRVPHEASPVFIQNREVAVLNIFTGFIGVVAAVTYLVT